jgi:hypothetical protein
LHTLTTWIVILATGSVLLSLVPTVFAQIPDRQVAITIDDLPAAGAKSMTAVAIMEMTSKLLTTLRDQKGAGGRFREREKALQIRRGG